MRRRAEQGEQALPLPTQEPHRRDTVIAYRDFVPQEVKGKWYQGTTYETFEAAVAAANQWMADERVSPLHVETVVLPNMETPSEESSADGKLTILSGYASWHQLVRIWYSVR